MREDDLEGKVGAIEALKPLTVLLHHLEVPALVDEGREIGEAGSQREVHEDELCQARRRSFLYDIIILELILLRSWHRI
jgi:hypothetical protein